MCTVDQGTLALISVIGGVVAAGGGALAAFAAFRSAVIAQNASEHAQKVERRSLYREVVSTVHAVIAESVRVDELANRLRGAYGTLFTFVGRGTDGSAETQLLEGVENKQSEVDELQQKALERLRDRKSLAGMAEEDLTELLTTYDGHLIQIRRIRETLSHDLASVELQNQEEAIRSRPGLPPPGYRPPGYRPPG
jgi:hypothetical protein